MKQSLLQATWRESHTLQSKSWGYCHIITSQDMRDGLLLNLNWNDTQKWNIQHDHPPKNDSFPPQKKKHGELPRVCVFFVHLPTKEGIKFPKLVQVWPTWVLQDSLEGPNLGCVTTSQVWCFGDGFFLHPFIGRCLDFWGGVCFLVFRYGFFLLAFFLGWHMYFVWLAYFFFRSHRGNVPPVVVRREFRLWWKSWSKTVISRPRKFRRHMKETNICLLPGVLSY